MSETWRDAYKDALLETDPHKVLRRIEVAQAAIRRRLSEQEEPLTKREFEDIDGALRTLRFLTKEAA
ncbi:MAG TPA: hypothetical protein VN708_00065 [Terriglobales bacterium]|jgi:hypothetical protein|nr:hypothetical protein [Terriglobales bacterium]HXU13491.1 hypothetical protein [Terriglobales bacterium]